ncbi:DUF1656 domain-containing protein [Vibrio sp. CAU 1672]|uniref:DUF1656 domain-containing protein n=1 Tax=Vibrio sp. CAU 1672 TaxID=3032594 RepID=UPI0023DCBAB1|nr:DUF1656 domain-containing protein [Vibrio sp. CAU 1672]MDF2154557.1 DUF1656 domain-containing protein [Vibrio sp. CAU 1672]
MSVTFSSVPHEIAFGDVYVPPLLVASAVGLAMTALTVRLFNRLKWHRFFVSPPLVELSLTVIYTVVISTFFIAA